MLIELTTFRLRAGADEAAFLAADERVQADLSPLEGFLRRTTARSLDDGRGWVVITLWWSEEAAVAGGADGLDDFVDDATVERWRYLTLD